MIVALRTGNKVEDSVDDASEIGIGVNVEHDGVFVVNVAGMASKFTKCERGSIERWEMWCAGSLSCSLSLSNGGRGRGGISSVSWHLTGVSSGSRFASRRKLVVVFDQSC